MFHFGQKLKANTFVISEPGRKRIMEVSGRLVEQRQMILFIGRLLW